MENFEQKLKGDIKDICGILKNIAIDYKKYSILSSKKDEKPIIVSKDKECFILSLKENEKTIIEKELISIARLIIGSKIISINNGLIIESEITQIELYADCIGDEYGDCYKSCINKYKHSKSFCKLLSGVRLYENSGRIDINIWPEFVPVSYLIRGIRHNDSLYTFNNNGHIHSWLLMGIDLRSDVNRKFIVVSDKSFFIKQKMQGLYLVINEKNCDIITSQRINLPRSNNWGKKKWNFRMNIKKDTT